MNFKAITAAVVGLTLTAGAAQAGLVERFDVQQQQLNQQREAKAALCENLFHNADWLGIPPGSQPNRTAGVNRRYTIHAGDLYLTRRPPYGKGCTIVNVGPMNKEFQSTYGRKQYVVVDGNLYEYFTGKDNPNRVNRSGLGTVPRVVFNAAFAECKKSNNGNEPYCVADVKRALHFN